MKKRNGFTLIELLIGSTIMLIIILASLYLYTKSNQVSVDQQQLAELQHDVRSSMYFISRDVRNAGVGLPQEFGGYFLEGEDNEDQGGEVTPDRLKLMGNMEDPLNLKIVNYQGAAANVSLEDYSFEQYPYPDSYYKDKVILLLPNPTSGCNKGALRQITHVTHSGGGTNEKINFSHGLAKDFNPPQGLRGTCPSSNDYDGGSVVFINVKEYWLDVTGNYPGLTAGEDGYIGNGEGGILYMTHNGVHYPLAKDIENLQFRYNGDFDQDGSLDGFTDWQESWTGDPAMVSRVNQIRMWVLGRTPESFASVSGTPPQDIHLYQRPAIANTQASSNPDMHRRFLLESTVTIRNLALNLYNLGTR